LRQLVSHAGLRPRADWYIVHAPQEPDPP